MEDDCIREGKYVVVQKVEGETYRVVRFTRTSKILVEKLRFECDGCIGHPYGLFEVSAMKATPISAEKRLEELRQSSGDLPFLNKNGCSAEVDTVKILVAESNDVEEEAEMATTAQIRQEVTQTEVLEMKSDGTRTTIIVDKLVQGNKGFANRTDYAQSKYISRKMKKHSDRILVMKPTIRLLASSFYTKDTEKFGMLRINQLGLLLQMGHIVHNRNVLVIDQLLGIVTAAILERLAGNGACIQVHRGDVPQSVPCLHAMNFDDETLAPYLPVRIKKLLGINDDGAVVKEEEMETGETADGSLDKPMAATTAITTDVNVKRAERIAREQRGLGFIASGVDSLILACRSIDVVDCLRILYPKLKPAGAVAIYHNDLQTLVRAQSWLMDNNCLNVALSEQMYRVQQVLPDRTHPMMTQHIASGYVLSGIKVLPAPTTS